VSGAQLACLVAGCKTKEQLFAVVEQHGRALLMLCETQEQLFKLVEPHRSAFSLSESVLALTLASKLPLGTPAKQVSTQAGMAQLLLRLAWERLEGDERAEPGRHSVCSVQAACR
jgi:hypothetical protein